jgi:beta-mannosidase
MPATFLDLENWAVSCDRTEWLDLPGPMTVAAALRLHGKWSLADKRDFDRETWWFRARLPRGERLHLGGLATFAEVSVDGKHVLSSDNMYHAHIVELPEDARSLELRFAPLSDALAQKRPRPRWKTRLTSHQQLRFIRTSLVGRMPGWSPPVAPVGPWRPVRVERRSLEPTDTERDLSKYSLEQTGEGPSVELISKRISTEVMTVRDPSRFRTPGISLRAWIENGRGIVDVAVDAAVLQRPLSLQPPSAEAPFISLVVGKHRAVLTNGGKARLEIEKPDLWWPHTHGAQPRYPAKLELPDGEIDLGHVSFRTVALQTERKFELSLNGVPIFCRGACWTTLDVATLTTSRDEYRRVLTAVKDAGMNMLRLTGTLFYEDDAFYELCDELGILVWQDFMFANMDYPIDDSIFRSSVEREIRQWLERTGQYACVALLCGGSEVEQQAAMFGAARELWRSTLFSELLPALTRELRPDIPYWPNSPAGGALPFHVDEGVAHYYGVGAYLRPFEDARRADVKFASECLAFANVPEDDLLPLFLGDGEAPFVSAKWKERTSKDNGSGWDFEDVRDHYVQRLFAVDPARVRYEEMERYLALSRVASGEAIARTLAEFRRDGSACAGALIWFLQDLWPGAGWGLLDSRGEPKSAYFYARRTMQPMGLFILDEGVNGLHLHVVNDGAAFEGRLDFTLYRDGETVVSQASQPVVVPARSKLALAADRLLSGFVDSAHAYKFGPSGHDVAIATLLQGDAVVAETSWLVDFAKPPPGGGLEGTLTPTHVTVTTRRFAHAVKIEVPGHVAADNYFDLAPGRTRTIAIRRMPSARPRSTLTGSLSALNLRTTVQLS